MGKDESVASPPGTMMATGAGIWGDEPGSLAHEGHSDVEALVAQVGDATARLAALAANPAAAAERVAELPVAYQAAAERVAELERAREADLAAVTELQSKLMDVERQLAEQKERADDLSRRASEFYELLHGSYVAREVPWTDVAAGMMTIARDGTPWMVETWDKNASDEVVVLRNGLQTFTKTPADGETVRVLEPYVTPEQAEGLVREQLGGTEVG